MRKVRASTGSDTPSLLALSAQALPASPASLHSSPPHPLLKGTKESLTSRPLLTLSRRSLCQEWLPFPTLQAAGPDPVLPPPERCAALLCAVCAPGQDRGCLGHLCVPSTEKAALSGDVFSTCPRHPSHPPTVGVCPHRPEPRQRHRGLGPRLRREAHPAGRVHQPDAPALPGRQGRGL